MHDCIAFGEPRWPEAQNLVYVRIYARRFEIVQLEGKCWWGVNADLDEKECEPSARLFHMSSSCCVRRRLSEMEESDPEKRGQKRPDQVK